MGENKQTKQTYNPELCVNQKYLPAAWDIFMLNLLTVAITLSQQTSELLLLLYLIMLLL